MGGYGSSRWGWHSRRCTVEESRSLLVRDLGIENLNDPQWRDYTRGGVGLRLGITTESPGQMGVAWLQRSVILVRSFTSDSPTELVQLLGQPMRFGGVRWWFICPSCSRRRMTLYLPTIAGGRSWSCRTCYGLKYRTQRLDPMSRFEARMHRVAKTLGRSCESSLDAPPAKQKWMRWSTYEKRTAAWWSASDARDMAWMQGMQSFLARIELRSARKP